MKLKIKITLNEHQIKVQNKTIMKITINVK